MRLLFIFVIIIFSTLTANAEEYLSYYQLGSQFEKEHNSEKALENYLQAHTLISKETTTDFKTINNKYAINLAIGTLYFKLQKPQDAIAYLETAVQLNPDKIAPNLAAGVCNKELGNFDEAIKYFEKVRNIDPNNTIASRELAELGKK